MSSHSRRNFLGKAALSAGVVARNPFAMILEAMYAGSIRQAFGQANGVRPRNYVLVQLSGGPPRWAFDLPLILSANDRAQFIANPGVATRFISASGSTNNSMDYATTSLTVNSKTLQMPWVWQYQIPRDGNGQRPMADLLRNALFIRGINVGFPDHPGASAAQFRPLGINTTLGGLVADRSPALLPAVNVETKEFIFRSAHGHTAINLGIGSSPLESLFSPFLYGGAGGPDDTLSSLSSVNGLQAKVNNALEKLDLAAQQKYGKFVDVNRASRNARGLINSNFGNLSVAYNGIKAKYDGLINRVLLETGTMAGINQGTIGAPSGRGAEYNVDKGVLANITNLNNAVKEVRNMAEHFAVAEYILKGGFSSFIAINPVGTVFNYEGNAEQFIGFDEHSTGRFPSLLIALIHGRAMGACLLHFISQLGTNLFADTLIQVGGEFGRIPTGNAGGNGGSDHGPTAGSTVFYSGAIQGPYVIGNISKGINNPSLKTHGTWGAGGRNVELGNLFNDNSGIIGLGYLTDTLATCLRVPSPQTSGNKSLVAEANGAIVPRLPMGKIV